MNRLLRSVAREVPLDDERDADRDAHRQERHPRVRPQQRHPDQNQPSLPPGMSSLPQPISMPPAKHLPTCASERRVLRHRPAV